MDDNLITPEVIERLKSRDARLEAIDVMLRIEKELDSSLALKLVLDRAAEEAAVALEKLADVDPSDTKQIVYLQAKVFRARFIAKTINYACLKGDEAERSLGEESVVELDAPEQDSADANNT